MIVADTVNEQMYELILNMILERRLKPGERIDPKQIAAENNVSLMPVRNALQILTSQGLVEMRQRVGAYVRSYSDEELFQIGEVRKVYELHCLEKFVQNIDKEDTLKLYQQMDVTDEMSRTMMILDEQLHNMIVSASRNPYLIQQYNNMQNLFRINMYMENDNQKSSKREHLSLLSAIYKGNYKYAYTVLERHLNRAIQEHMDWKPKAE